MNLKPADLEDLKCAVGILEKPSLAARLNHIVGAPLEKAIDHLPALLAESVHEASRRAIEKALQFAIATLNSEQQRHQPANLTHQVLSGVSGAFGGFFGAPALVIELPLSTTIILRSIVDIARSEGEAITSPKTRMACVEVFAFGGRTWTDDGAETGYYAVRTGLAKSVSEAIRYLARQGTVDTNAPVLVRLISKIASRFGLTVTQKLAAQAVPAFGALGGAAINVLFTQHFQTMARGHFIIRRLESRYGDEVVKLAYETLRKEI